MRSRSTRLAVATMVVLLIAISAAPVAATTAPYLVKNIHASGSSEPRSLTAVGNTLFFTADDGVHGRELWKSNGTGPGTLMVRDITPDGADVGSDWPGDLTAIGNVLYFTGNDAVNGAEPWISDGTFAGTRMIKDINPGLPRSGPYGYTEYNGKVYFLAGINGQGQELWRTDGTEEGTELVAEVPGPDGLNPTHLTVFAGKLYFLREYYKSGLDHAVLYRTDGTAAGTKPFKDKNGLKIQGNFGRNASGALYVIGSNLFIGRNDKELWRSGGTQATTQRIATVGTRDMIGVGGIAFFALFNGTFETPTSGLWISDGSKTGTKPLFDENGDPIDLANSSRWALTPLGDELLFFDLYEGIWTSDGTPAGTAPLGVAVWPGYSSVALNGVGYFDGAECCDLATRKLWQSDGTLAATHPVSGSPDTAVMHSLTPVGDSLYFVARAGKGTELWRFVP